jgi:hypothetical protein
MQIDDYGPSECVRGHETCSKRRVGGIGSDKFYLDEAQTYSCVRKAALDLFTLNDLHVIARPPTSYFFE